MKMRSKSIKQCGFSLIEMLMVVAIMAIVGAIAIPFFGGFLDNRDLKSAGRDIVGDIYELRQRAISENRWYQITFNQGTNSYILQQCANTGSPCGNFNDMIAKSPSVFRSDISISNVNINGGAVLQMQPTGLVSPTTGGSVQLQNVPRGSSATVTITLTGRTYVNWALQ